VRNALILLLLASLLFGLFAVAVWELARGEAENWTGA
jgi:hypothetical protein